MEDVRDVQSGLESHIDGLIHQMPQVIDQHRKGTYTSSTPTGISPSLNAAPRISHWEASTKGYDILRALASGLCACTCRCNGGTSQRIERMDRKRSDVMQGLTTLETKTNINDKTGE